MQTAVMLLFILSGMPWGYPAAWVAAGICTFRKSCRGTALLQSLGVLAAVSICFGGLLQGILEVAAFPLLAGMLLAAGLLCAGGGFLLRHKNAASGIWHAVLQTEQGSHEVQAILDTGNSLREPLTGKPVSIICAAAAEHFLNPGWEQERGFFLIPYHSLGTEKAWMKGVMVPYLRLEQNGKQTEVENAVLAIYEGRISSTQQYQMLLHPEHISGIHQGRRKKE